MNNEGGVETNRSHRSSCLIFAAGAALFLLLCRGGVRPEPFTPKPALHPALDGVLLFTLAWAGCIGLMFILPRRLGRLPLSGLLLTLALLCRLLIIPFDAFTNAGIHHYLGPYFGQKWMANELLVIRLTAIFFEMGTLFFLLKLLAYRCLSLRWAILYAFNPVILFNLPGQILPDAVFPFFLLGALCCYDTRRFKWMFLMGGVAFHLNHAAACILILLVSGNTIRYLWVLILTIAGAYVILLVKPASDRIFEFPVFSGGAVYGVSGFIHGFFLNLSGSAVFATSGCEILFAAACLFGLARFHPVRSSFHRNEPVSGVFFILGSLALLSPAMDFRNLGWLLPFIALRPHASWLLLCVIVSGGLLFAPEQQHLPLWLRLPLYILFLRDACLFRARRRWGVRPAVVQTLSVIIPARNEGRHIAACINEIRQDPAVTEIIVVDGGSGDDTPDQAQAAGARLIRHPAPPGKGGGRGGQIMAGLEKAGGDLVAVVHADTRVSRPVFSNLIRLMNRQPMLAGGSVGTVFTGKAWHLRLLETANDFRAAFLGISFGDQVQFFRRQPVVERKLFPAIPLMEDVELGLRLSRLGRQTHLFGRAAVSDRKWRTGAFRRFILIIRLFWVYMWRRLWQKPDTLMMYRQYYDGTQKGGADISK